jgi:methionyl-tRNA formyltransferase
MRVLFAGSPAIAVPSLCALSELELEGKLALAAVLTNPDSRRGRHGREDPTDVAAACAGLDSTRLQRGLPPIAQLKPEKLDSAARKEIAALKPDLLVSFAYGRIFGPRFLALFPLGGVNVHPSLLPKYRGATPIPAAILASEKETGICVQKLAAEIDSGDILAADIIQLSGRETTLSLSGTAGKRAALLLRELFTDFNSRLAAARPQEGEALYCHEIKKEAGVIDWGKSAREIDAQIRAYTPWPLSYTSVTSMGKDTLFILEARPFDSSVVFSETAVPGTVLGTDKNSGILIQTGNGILAVSRLQWQAKKALDWDDFCNGARNFLGTRFAVSG